MLIQLRIILIQFFLLFSFFFPFYSIFTVFLDQLSSFLPLLDNILKDYFFILNGPNLHNSENISFSFSFFLVYEFHLSLDAAGVASLQQFFSVHLNFCTILLLYFYIFFLSLDYVHQLFGTILVFFVSLLWFMPFLFNFTGCSSIIWPDGYYRAPTLTMWSQGNVHNKFTTVHQKIINKSNLSCNIENYGNWVPKRRMKWFFFFLRFSFANGMKLYVCTLSHIEKIYR